VRRLGALTGRLVHPTAPVLLTKNGPLGAQIQNFAAASIKEKRPGFSPIESLRIG
jgi:hypothetical protein